MLLDRPRRRKGWDIICGPMSTAPITRERSFAFAWVIIGSVFARSELMMAAPIGSRMRASIRHARQRTIGQRPLSLRDEDRGSVSRGQT